MNKFAALDHKYLWHPFTQMRDWFKTEPIVISKGRGAVLEDVHGRKYLDANASIWTNLHGHAHPKINAAIKQQLGKISHSSALGLANEPASLLAERLVLAANSSIKTFQSATNSNTPENKPVAASDNSNRNQNQVNPALTRVFFSDNGSTTLEVALKLAYEYSRRTGRSSRPKFLSLQGAYHGDTIGAVSLGHIDLFHKAYSGMLFKSDQVMAPYCYRCPFNRAQPERADAREYRQCKWECLGLLEKKLSRQSKRGNPYAAFIFEPLMQGAAGMIAQPNGWLNQAASMARNHGALLIADEVMTGFGRMGFPWHAIKKAAVNREHQSLLFGSHHEGIQPDFLCLAKGLTGGYLPMAATLTTSPVFDSFLGEYEELKSFFHGHSFTSNQLGAAASLASMELLAAPACLKVRAAIQNTMKAQLATLWDSPHVGDIRQTGLVAGVELVRDWRTREPYDFRDQAGIKVCNAMARKGVLTRHIGNVISLLPPYCMTPSQVETVVTALHKSIQEVLG